MRIGLGVINFLPTRFVVFRTDRKANVAQKCRDSKGVPFLYGFCLICLSGSGDSRLRGNDTSGVLGGGAH